MKHLLYISLLCFYPTLCSAQNESNLLFESSKGKWPVPLSKYVNIENKKRIQYANCNSADSTLKINADSSYNVIAVHDAETIRVYKIENEYSVIIHFGDYVVIYTGLNEPNVKNGDNIKTGQKISSLYKSPGEDFYILNLSLFYKGAQLNPRTWIKW